MLVGVNNWVDSLALAEEPLLLNDMEICDLGVGERSGKPAGLRQSMPAHKTSIVPNPARDAFAITVQG